MSAGGLIGSMLLNGTANMAEGIAQDHANSLEQKRAMALEKIRHSNNMAVQNARDTSAQDRLTTELAARAEQGQLNRSHELTKARIAASSKGSAQPKIGRYKPVEDAEGNNKILDTATGQFVQPNAASLQDILGSKKGQTNEGGAGSRASAPKPMTMTQSWENAAPVSDVKPGQKTSQQIIYDKQLANISAALPGLKGVRPAESQGLLQGTRPTPQQNSVRHFLGMLDNIMETGTQEQQQQAQQIFQEFSTN